MDLGRGASRTSAIPERRPVARRAEEAKRERVRDVGAAGSAGLAPAATRTAALWLKYRAWAASRGGSREAMCRREARRNGPDSGIW